MKLKLTIRRILILTITLLVVSVALLLTYMSYLHNKRTSNQLISSSAQNLNNSIYNQISYIFKVPGRSCRVNANLIERQVISGSNQDALIKYFSTLIRSYDNVNSIYFANPRGGLANAGIDRELNRYYTIHTEGFDKGTFYKYEIDDNFNRTKLITQIPHFDSSIRPWFQAAILSDDVVWGDPYLVATQHDLGITVSKAARDESGRLLGVVGIDMFISDISKLLSRIEQEHDIITMIMDASGLMVASSREDNVFTMSRTDNVISRVEALGSDSALIRNAASTLAGRSGGLGNIDTDIEIPIRVGKDEYLLHAKPFQLNKDTQWLIVTLSPKTKFIQILNRHNRTFFVLLFFLLLLSVSSAIYLAGIISRPIEALNRKIQDPNHDWSEDPKPSMLVETDNLAIELHEMQRTIQENIETLYDEIQHRKNTETALIQAKETAEENNRLKSNFLSNMSHEVRTPLNGILGFAELLREELNDERTHNMAVTIYKSGKRLLHTLDMVLDLSRIEANKQEITWHVLDLNDAVYKPVHLFTPSVTKKHLKLNFIPLDAPIYLRTDPTILNHILHELIANARKFTEEGAITVRLENNINTDGNICISVSDTGIGISKEHLAVVFEPFRQASEGWNRSFEGTGLGLSLCKKYAKLIHGEIKVQSEIGKGSTFSLLLPANLLCEPPAEPLDQVVKQENELPKVKVESNFLPRILLVDDDYVCYSLVSKMLRDFAEVVHAPNGMEALDMIKHNSYPLILLDINLKSNLSGLIVLDEIRKLPLYSGVPVVAVTAYAMKGDREGLMGQGFSDYLSKPFNKEDLLKIFRQWI